MELLRCEFGLAQVAAPAPSDFTTVAVIILIAVTLAALILAATTLIGPRRRGKVKEETYESGMEPFSDTRRRFSVRFYLVAVLFLIFDVEIVFLYPWAVLLPCLHAAPDSPHYAWATALRDAGYTPLWLLGAIGLFFTLLLVGFYYEWRRGAFKWS